jgi:hypothetical protein
MGVSRRAPDGRPLSPAVLPCNRCSGAAVDVSDRVRLRGAVADLMPECGRLSRQTLHVVLLEKNRLCRNFFEFLKVAQANTNEAVALERSEINPFSQLQGDIS